MTLTAQPAAPAPSNGVDLSRRYTREEYFALPEGPPYYELVDGKLVMSPRPSVRHQQLLMFLTVHLWPHAVGVLGGELISEPNLLLPGTEDVLQPDFLYLGPEQLGFLSDLVVEGAPEMVCEVLSPSTRRRDHGAKLTAYQQARVSHVWLIDPQAPLAVLEYVLDADGRYRLEANLEAPGIWTPALFPGWSLDLSAAQARLFTGATATDPMSETSEGGD